MSELPERVEGEILNRRLLLRGQKILLAVSGGVDSMVLLQTLSSLASKNRWEICVAHFNHHLRGRASNADEKLVRRTAEKLRLKFFNGGADVKKFAAQSKLSIEMAARKLRHEFLARVAREQKISTIALAHHADDQVELFFLRLLRGAGGAGLTGMKWQSPSPADKKVRLVRPLLGCAKNELLAFAREQKIEFRDDASNASTDFLRNRIRNELVPLLRKKYQPGLDKNILRVMEIVGAEAEYVTTTAQNWQHGRADLPVSQAARQHFFCGLDFDKLPVAIQRKALQQQLIAAGVPVDFDLIEQLRAAAGKWVSVSPDISIARNGAGEIELRRETMTQFDLAEIELNLQGRAGQVTFAGKNIHWKISAQKKFLVPPLKTCVEYFDADKVGGDIILRHWHAGDRFQPIGLKAAVKLQDLFVNAKIPAARRRDLVLATTGVGEIFWVEGLRIGERFKLTPETKRHLGLRWQSAAATPLSGARASRE